jgi:apolipoprotein N-acyltransferase
MLTSVVGLHWLPKPLMLHGGVSPSVAWLLTVTYCGYQACRWAVLGWLVASERAAGMPRGLAFCLAYPVSELVLPLLLPWHLGEMVPATSWLAQCADLGGPLLVSMLVASLGVASARLVDGWRAARNEWLAHAVVWTCALGYGALQEQLVREKIASAPHVRVGIVQANAHAGDAEARDTLERALELTRPLLSPDLVVWSETITSVRLTGLGEDSALTRLLANRVAAPLLFGASTTFDDVQAGETGAYNSAFLTYPRSPLCRACRYDKQLLFPIGEYIPGASLWRPLRHLFPRGGAYSPGPQRHALPLGSLRVAVTICYEDLHASYVRDLVTGGPAALIVNLTDDAWFQGTPGSAWHFKLSVFRAVEQRRAFVRVANSGVSASVDALGQVLHRLPTDVATASVVTSSLLDGVTLFARVGDAPFWLLAVILLGNLLMPCVARLRARGRPLRR